MAYDPLDPEQAPPEGTMAWHATQLRERLRDVVDHITAPFRSIVDRYLYHKELLTGYREELNAANQQLDAAHALIASAVADVQASGWRAAAETWLDNSLSSTGSSVGDATARSTFWSLGAQVAGFYHGLHENGVALGHAAYISARYLLAVVEQARKLVTVDTPTAPPPTESTDESTEQVAHD